MDVVCFVSHPVVQVLGECVDQQDLSDGGGSIQTHSGVEVCVPEHGASGESDQQSHDQNRQQSHEPAQHTTHTAHARSRRYRPPAHTHTHTHTHTHHNINKPEYEAADISYS